MSEVGTLGRVLGRCWVTSQDIQGYKETTRGQLTRTRSISGNRNIHHPLSPSIKSISSTFQTRPDGFFPCPYLCLSLVLGCKTRYLSWRHAAALMFEPPRITHTALSVDDLSHSASVKFDSVIFNLKLFNLLSVLNYISSSSPLLLHHLLFTQHLHFSIFLFLIFLFFSPASSNITTVSYPFFPCSLTVMVLRYTSFIS